MMFWSKVSLAVIVLVTTLGLLCGCDDHGRETTDEFMTQLIRRDFTKAYWLLDSSVQSRVSLEEFQSVFGSHPAAGRLARMSTVVDGEVQASLALRPVQSGRPTEFNGLCFNDDNVRCSCNVEISMVTPYRVNEFRVSNCVNQNQLTMPEYQVTINHQGITR